MASTPSASEYRVALGRSYIALQSEVKTLIAEQDGRSWFAFAQKEAYHNIMLLQDGDDEYLERWMNRALATDFEHYVMVCGDAIEKRKIFEKDYVWECDLPIMTVELASLGDQLKFQDNVQAAVTEDREAIAALLAECFDTTSEAAIAISAGAGHASPNVAAWKIEEDGVILGHLATCVVGDFVSVWSVGISEKARRRGFATALLNHGLAHALKLGAKYGVLLASEDGQNVYARHGWSTLETIPLYVTQDSYAQIPNFEPQVNRQWLRAEHGRIDAAIVSESPHLLCELGEDNWHVVPDSLGFALCQSRHYHQVLEFAKKVIESGRLTYLMLAGHAKQYSEKLLEEISMKYPPKEETVKENSIEVKKMVPILIPDDAMPAMVYDLLKKDDAVLNSVEKSDTSLRIATIDDRTQIGVVISKAFGGGGAGSRRLNPYALGAGSSNPNVLNWVLEVEEEGKKKIVATVTSVVRNKVAHIWGVATHPDYQRKGYSMRLLKRALLHARDEQGARMGFLIATVPGFPVYEKMGWKAYEEWSEFLYRGQKVVAKPSEH